MDYKNPVSDTGDRVFFLDILKHLNWLVLAEISYLESNVNNTAARANNEIENKIDGGVKKCADLNLI